MSYIRKITRAGQLTEEYKKYVEQQKRKIKKAEALKSESEAKKATELREEMKEEAKQKRAQDRRNQKIRQQLGLKYNMSSSSNDLDDDLKKLIEETPDKVLQAYESGSDELLLKRLMKMRLDSMDAETRAKYNADKETNDSVTMLNLQVKLHELFRKIGKEVTKVRRSVEKQKAPAAAPVPAAEPVPAAAPEAPAAAPAPEASEAPEAPSASPMYATEEEARKAKKKAKRDRQKKREQKENEEREREKIEMEEREREEREKEEIEKKEKEEEEREYEDEMKVMLSDLYGNIPEEISEIDNIYKVDPANARQALAVYIGENYDDRAKISSFLDRGGHDDLIELILNFNWREFDIIREKSKKPAYAVRALQRSWLVPKSVLSNYERRTSKKVAKGRSQGYVIGGKQAMRNRLFDKIDNLYAAGLINKTQHKQIASQLI